MQSLFINQFSPILSILFAIIFPLVVFIVCDRNRRKTIGGLPTAKSAPTLQTFHPAEIAALYAGGNFRTEFIWAEILDLAVKKKISIEKSGHALLWIPRGGYHIEYIFSVATTITQAEFAKLNPLSQTVMAIIFPSDRKTNLFLNREYLAAKIPGIGEMVRLSLFRKGLLSPEAAALKSLFLTIGTIFLVLGILIIGLDPVWRFSLAISGLITILFFLTTRATTAAGEETIEKIKQLQNNIQNFGNGKAGIKKNLEEFERLLPAAMALGMADILDGQAHRAYGLNFFLQLRPSWYSGYKDENEFYGGKLYSQLSNIFKFRGIRVATVYPDNKNSG